MRERLSSLATRSAHDPRVAWGLALVQAIVAIVAIRRDTFLDNEGIFSWIFATMLADDPITTAFFLKSRPPLAALYALPASVGFEAFAVCHALVAALAIPLTAALSRSFGHARPNVAAALVFASSLSIACGASGVGNSDAMTLCALAAALLFAWSRPASAGAVAAILPLARAETALLVLALSGYALFADRVTRRRFFTGLLVPASAFTLAGAVYHRQPLWFLEHGPHVLHSVPFSEVMGREMFGGEPHMVVLTLLTLTPAVGLIPFLRPADLSRPERALAAFVAVYIGLLSVLPALSPLNFGDMPRYLLPSLPFLALLASRALEPLASEPGPSNRAWTVGVLWLTALLLVGHVQDASRGASALLWAVAGWSLVVLFSQTRSRRSVPLLVVALCIATVPVLLPASRLSNPETEVLGRSLVRDPPPGTLVLTNVAELPLWLSRNGGANIDVRHMMAADQRYEIDTLTNEAVGQRARIHALMRDHWYGPVVFADEIAALLTPGTWLALREDARTGHILDESAIAGRVETVDLGYGTRIVRLVPR